MKPEIVRLLPNKVAHELLNDLVMILNNLYEVDQRRAFFQLGTLVEEVSQRTRDETKSS